METPEEKKARILATVKANQAAAEKQMEAAAEAAEAEEVETPEITTEIAISTKSKEVQTAFELLEDFETIPEENLQEATGEYLKFDPANNPYNFIFLGMTTIKDPKGELKPAVQLMDKSRQVYINADIVLVNTAKSQLTAPCLIRVICKGTRPGKNGGSYKDLEILKA